MAFFYKNHIFLEEKTISQPLRHHAFGLKTDNSSQIGHLFLDIFFFEILHISSKPEWIHSRGQYIAR